MTILILGPAASFAATLHAELTAGLDRATASIDCGAFAAALIEAIGRSAGDARNIVIYASHSALAYAPAAAAAARDPGVFRPS